MSRNYIGCSLINPQKRLNFISPPVALVKVGKGCMAIVKTNVGGKVSPHETQLGITPCKKPAKLAQLHLSVAFVIHEGEQS